MRRNLIIVAAVALVGTACAGAERTMGPEGGADALFAAGAASVKAADQQSFEVTIANLMSGQPLTPPVVATHSRAADVFTVGAPASFQVKEVAENGNLGPLVTALSAHRHVSDVVVAVAGDPPPILPGGSVTFQLSAGPGARFFSIVSMLVCTNDGFTGVDSRKLPQRVGQEIVLYTDAYDAGTEINTEDFADIVPPCQVLIGVTSDDAGTGTSNPALAENGVVHHHNNVQGGDDLLPGVHGWSDPVARISIRRID